MTPLNIICEPAKNLNFNGDFRESTVLPMKIRNEDNFPILFKVCCKHSYYWPSPFAYTKVPESDYTEKSQKTLGIFGNFSVIY